MMASSAVRFLATVLTGVALIPSGAHLLEMPNKMNLDADAYSVVQQIYAGWALWGAVQVAALVAIIALAITASMTAPAFGLPCLARLRSFSF